MQFIRGGLGTAPRITGASHTGRMQAVLCAGMIPDAAPLAARGAHACLASHKRAILRISRTLCHAKCNCQGETQVGIRDNGTIQQLNQKFDSENVDSAGEN